MKSACKLVILLLAWVPLLAAQDQSDTSQHSAAVDKGIDLIFNYLNMAGAKKAADFQPMTQPERNRLYFKTMVNPIGFFKAGFSAGIDQLNDKPEEWGQGASGYGSASQTLRVMRSNAPLHSVASALHEDNRYFNSGKHGLWPRSIYALESGVLARHDDGSRHISVSQIGGVAAGAFVSRLWQPPSQSSAGDGAVSFGITMASNAGFGLVKEFLPDLGRKLGNRHKQPKGSPPLSPSSELNEPAFSGDKTPDPD